MSGTFLVAKYVPDLRRMEPRNIGVAVWLENGQTAHRFVGDEDRLPRELRVNDKKNYRRWINCWKTALDANVIEDDRGKKVARTSATFMEAIRSLSSGNYVWVEGGNVHERLVDDRLDAGSVAAELYLELVGPKATKEKSRESEHLHKLSSNVLTKAGILQREDIAIKQDVLYKPYGITKYFRGDFILGPTRQPTSLLQEVVLGHSKTFDSTVYHIDWFLKSYQYDKNRCVALVTKANRQVEGYEQNRQILQQVATVVEVDDESEAVPQIRQLLEV